MDTRIERHIKVLAALHFILAIAGWSTLVITFREAAFGLVVEPTIVDHIASTLFGVIAGAPVFVPILVGAVGLVRRRPWARSLMLGVSALGVLLFFLIITFPIGVYGILVLSGAKAKAYFGETVPEPPAQAIDPPHMPASA
jgi:hypothetical protein